MSGLPVAVIGAGPQGLAAAAHLLERGLEPLVLESGPGPGTAVTGWAHVRTFSPWPELLDAAAVRLLVTTGWQAPAQGYPTGEQWVAAYLAPLAAALGGRVRYDARVVGVTRLGRDRLDDAGRAGQPFVVRVRDTDGDGTESRVLARAVVDASGTSGLPNPLGADGLPALGEAAVSDLVSTRIPSREEPERHAGRHTVVVGAGHSAFTAVNELVRISQTHPGTRITWAIRRGVGAGTFGGGGGDQLPRRGALGQRARRAVESGAVQLVTGFRTAEARRVGARAVLRGEDDRLLPAADVVVALTGLRPDLSFLSELRLDLDPTLEAPRRLAVEIDPNVHSCGSVRATGAADLAQPEPDLYLVGMKSYGQAPTFLAMTGYEQVRSVVAALAGDVAGAARVELALPETGVCAGTGSIDQDDAADDSEQTSCCAPSDLGRVPVGLG